LTIKLTRCTRAVSQELLATSEQTRTRREILWAIDPAHRVKRLLTIHTPAGISGTHKNLQPCRLPNLFSCQTSSSLTCVSCPPERDELLPTQYSAPSNVLGTGIRNRLLRWRPILGWSRVVGSRSSANQFGQ
jgi:hypothetical protein